MPFGYGNMTVVIDGKKRTVSTHCLSYALYNGPVGKDDHVLHRCDVGACINPDHLYLGTLKDNSADCVARGRNRQPRGIASGRAKLTDDEVREIRCDPRPLRKIAVAYGVSKGPVTAIKAGKSWRHVL